MRRLNSQAELRRLLNSKHERSLLQLAVYLCIVLALHTAAMMTLEGLSFEQAVWLTATTAVTVGYGDFAAQTTLGRFATILLLYGGGIFVLFHAAANYFEYRLSRRMKMIQGRWSWKMKDHILILNTPQLNTVNYFRRLCEEFHNATDFRGRPILVVTDNFPDGLPEEIREFGVVHVHAHATDSSALIEAGAADAAAILVLAEDATDKRSDATSFDILHRLGEIGTKASILAESVEDSNKPRLRRAGAMMVLRPIRFYPEIVVRGFVCPGAEAVLENLFTNVGEECHGYKVNIRAENWIDVVAAALKAGLGTAIGFQSRSDDTITTNPPATDPVDAKALFLIVNENNVLSNEDMQNRLSEIGLR